MLYSIGPLALAGVAVIMVVPPLHAMVPAEAVTVSGQPGITCMEEVELLSAVLSPAKVPGVEHTTPFENNRLPVTVEGPPITLP